MSGGCLLFRHGGQQRGAGGRRDHERRFLEHEAAAEGRIASKGGRHGAAPFAVCGHRQIEGEWFPEK